MARQRYVGLPPFRCIPVFLDNLLVPASSLDVRQEDSGNMLPSHEDATVMPDISHDTPRERPLIAARPSSRASMRLLNGKMLVTYRKGSSPCTRIMTDVDRGLTFGFLAHTRNFPACSKELPTSLNHSG